MGKGRSANLPSIYQKIDREDLSAIKKLDEFEAANNLSARMCKFFGTFGKFFHGGKLSFGNRLCKSWKLRFIEECGALLQSPREFTWYLS